MSDRRIRVGIVGVGLIGYNGHVKTCQRLSDLFKVEAICDLNEDRGAKVAREYNARFYRDLSGICGEVDLIVVAVPGVFHKEYGIRTMEMGKDVIVEKPMALNVEEADELIACAKQRGRKLFVHQNRRWDPDFLTVKNILEEGMLGEVFVIESKVGKFGRVRGLTVGEHIDWRLTKRFGGGRLNEWGTHLIDQMLLLSKHRPTSVYADLQNRCWNWDADDHVNIMMRFEDGLLGKIEISQSTRIPLYPRWFICGTRGTLMGIFGIHGERHLGREGFTVKVGEEEGDVEEVDISLVRPKGDDFYLNVYDVITNDAEPAVKLEEVRAVMAIVDAARESDRTGESVGLTSE